MYISYIDHNDDSRQNVHHISAAHSKSDSNVIRKTLTVWVCDSVLTVLAFCKYKRTVGTIAQQQLPQLKIRQRSSSLDSCPARLVSEKVPSLSLPLKRFCDNLEFF